MVMLGLELCGHLALIWVPTNTHCELVPQVCMATHEAGRQDLILCRLKGSGISLPVSYHRASSHCSLLKFNHWEGMLVFRQDQSLFFLKIKILSCKYFSVPLIIFEETVSLQYLEVLLSCQDLGVLGGQQ